MKSSLHIEVSEDGRKATNIKGENESFDNEE
jgi:hypothetical protein